MIRKKAILYIVMAMILGVTVGIMKKYLYEGGRDASLDFPDRDKGRKEEMMTHASSGTGSEIPAPSRNILVIGKDATAEEGALSCEKEAVPGEKSSDYFLGQEMMSGPEAEISASSEGALSCEKEALPGEEPSEYFPERQRVSRFEAEPAGSPQDVLTTGIGLVERERLSPARYLTDPPPMMTGKKAPHERGVFDVPLIGGASIRKKVVSMREAKFKDIVAQEFDYSCGAASLATLLRYYFGKEISETDVMEGMLRFGNPELIRKSGFSLLDMQKFAKHLGYKSSGYRVTMEQLAKIPVPVIVLITTNGRPHFSVLRGIAEETAFIADPGSGNYTMTLVEFEKRWNGIIFVVQGPIEGQPGGLSAKASVRTPKGEFIGIRERTEINFALDPTRTLYLHEQLPPESFFTGSGGPLISIE